MRVSVSDTRCAVLSLLLFVWQMCFGNMYVIISLGEALVAS